MSGIGMASRLVAGDVKLLTDLIVLLSGAFVTHLLGKSVPERCRDQVELKLQIASPLSYTYSINFKQIRRHVQYRNALPSLGHMTRYNAEISAGSLLPFEGRRIALLLMSNPTPAAWVGAIETENVLQKKTPATARRQARLLQRRLTTLDAQAWEMIANRETEVATQLLLAAAVKHSQLLGDFMRRVYADRQRRLEPALLASDWQDFLVECAHHDSAVGTWSDSTKAKLFQVIVRILAESRYLENARSMKLTPQSLHPDVRRYLAAHDETYVLDCLERLR